MSFGYLKVIFEILKFQMKFNATAQSLKKVYFKLHVKSEFWEYRDKTERHFLKKLNIELSYAPALDIYWKQLEAETQTDICRPISTAGLFAVAQRQKQKISIDQWVGKQNVVYAYNRILFSLKIEGTSQCYNLNEPWTHYTVKSARHKRTNNCMILLIWGTKSSQIQRDRT